MTTPSTNICLQLLDQITFYVVVPRGPQGFLTEADKSFILLSRMLQGLGNLQRNQSTPIADWNWHQSISTTIGPNLSEGCDEDTFLFERICTFVTALAELNVR
jgi:hypothetical protein